MPNKSDEKNQRQVFWRRHASNNYHGRNGFGTAIGIDVWDLHGDDPKAQLPDDQIFLQPITKKTRESTPSCTIQIPRESLRDVARAILGDDLLLDKVLNVVRDRLPTLLGLDPELDKIIEEKLREKPAAK